ncbi:dienelactone hydrolase family protein [Oceanicaulis sp. MMSF_3324]|uniref:dienelactone hydrolase family protein n=1 Tax=Oceanicaulis sp. MMSF_3324 TaxID=3046702 RepID=UPI00273E5F22|nr:prolyl oligopeptidase family serine peptidase [Oceanicaulis sp. MMSF_3324]
MDVLIWVLAIAGAGVLAFALYIGWSLYRRLRGQHMARKPFSDHVAFMEPYVRVSYPPGDGPFPAVLLFHGCGGVRQVTENYAALAVKAGVAAVIVDSLRARAISYEQALAQVCTGHRLWGRERAADVYAALELIRQDKQIDPQRLALAGWSHGGWTVLDALTLARMQTPPDGLSDAPEQPFKGVTGVFLVYPYVSGPSLAVRNDWLADIPIEGVLVERDSMASEADASVVFSRAREHGASVSWSVLGGVTHAFDEPDHHPESALRYDPQATLETQGRFSDFLKRRLTPGVA